MWGSSHFLRHIEPEQRHRLVELGARDLAVAVRVPLAEEVDHARRVGAKRRGDLVLDWVGALCRGFAGGMPGMCGGLVEEGRREEEAKKSDKGGC